MSLRLLPDHCDSQPRQRRLLCRHRGVQTVRVIRRCLPKGIQLMSRPQIRRQSLNELSRLVDPVELLQLGRQRNLCEFLDPLLALVLRQRIPIGKLPFQASPFGWELEVVVNRFAQQAWNKAERQSTKRPNVVLRQLPRFGRVVSEVFRFEIAGQHETYTSS